MAQAAEGVKGSCVTMMTTTEKTTTESFEPEANKITITPKSSRAMIIWLAVVITVLAVLWFETRDHSARNFNLFLSGEADTVGSEVFIDGKKLGQMVESGNSGLGGGAFWTHLNDGPHVIEVRKPEFATFSKQINMKREDYIAVSLKPKKANHSDTDDAELDVLGGD